MSNVVETKSHFISTNSSVTEEGAWAERGWEGQRQLGSFTEEPVALSAAFPGHVETPALARTTTNGV